MEWPLAKKSMQVIGYFFGEYDDYSTFTRTFTLGCFFSPFRFLVYVQATVMLLKRCCGC